jgi:hypothetical protein
MRLLPKRRQHLRIMTLKNAAWLLAGLIVLFLVFSTWNELGPGDPSRERLYQRGSDGTPPRAAPAPAKAIEERPITDQTSTVRGGANSLAPPPPLPPSEPAVAPAESPRRLTLKEARRRRERIVITGGAEGVRVEATPATKTEPAVPPDRF